MANKTAAQRHELNRTLAVEQLLELSSLVAENNQRFHAEGSTNWGYVGDLGRINYLLKQALNKEGRQ